MARLRKERQRGHLCVDLMTKDFQVRSSAVLLVLLTAAAAICAWVNLTKEREFEVPYDGVWWMEKDGRVEAQRIDDGSAGQKAGIKPGDVLQAIDEQPVRSTSMEVRQLYRVGVWNKTTYTLERNRVSIEVPLILQPKDRSLNMGLRAIALVYLGIGLYVLLRRWTAPKSLHFYIFCLVSFVFYAFHYTGKLNAFDWTIYWGNMTAWLLQPAIFLHFALTFPERKEMRHQSGVIALLYLPATLILLLQLWLLEFAAPNENLHWNLDRLQMLYLAVYFLVATVILWRSYLAASTPLLRLQLKWITRGVTLAITPFTLFYILPYLAGKSPTLLMKLSWLSLVVLPLTFGYAIVRYRLMDVDLIFKRGVAYTISAAAIAGGYFAVIGVAAEIFHQSFPSAGPGGMIAAIVVTSVLANPVRNWIQARLDRLFYRQRYDYRNTLIEFGRDLNSETDLDQMLAAIVDRLSHTLLVDRVAVFLRDPISPEKFLLAKSCGIAPETGEALELGFLGTERDEFQHGHLFFDNTRHAVREAEASQRTIARLDLNYYIPCTVVNRVIAVLGLGKTMDGDFLSSEDVALLETLAGYIGIALQNARLYASLAQKAQEYERLKEFNENIVESVNIGIFAVDLNDNIESWNSQMELMYQLPRTRAVGRSLAEVMPPSFCEDFLRVRENPGIHNLYKFRLATQEGQERVVNIAIAPLLSRDFNIVGRLIILDDITERIELETQLSHADKMSSIGLLAAGVAHEVNTPLAVISSYTQLLAKQLQGDEKRSELLDKIIRQTFRASEIVNNLLNFSRTSGTEFGEVDLNRIIHDTLALLEHPLHKARIQVIGDLAPDLPLIYGNQGKLQQVFLNLFLNARDAMPEGGTLRVTTSGHHEVQVAIADTGTGIAPEHIHKIYDPFFTTKQRPKQGGTGGTGLGLSVTYGIIQEHAGTIRVESRQGEGTHFYLEFPMTRKVVNV
jgi:PAS domain S-box-containing protein